MASESEIRAEIERQIQGNTSVAPRDIAQALAKEGQDWRKLLPEIRRQAVTLHSEDKLVFVRKRKIVSPEGLKGVFRLARPDALS